MFHNIIKVIAPRVGSATLTIKQFSPELYLAAGLVTGVAAAVMFAKAHKKSDEAFEEDLYQLKSYREYMDDPIDEEDRIFTPAEKAKFIMPVYKDITITTVKLYGPPTALAVASVALILTSHGVMKGRTQALAGALTLFQQGFSLYRSRVVQELGEEADERYMHGADLRPITVMETDEDGKVSKRKTAKNHIPEVVSPMIYSRLFDETNNNWEPDESRNYFFLRAAQSQANDIYHINGYILLNDVYKALGFAPSPEGAVCGWSKNIKGDDYVSFGLDNDINQREGDNRWVLDFNVNGVVYHLIGE